MQTRLFGTGLVLVVVGIAGAVLTSPGHAIDRLWRWTHPAPEVRRDAACETTDPLSRPADGFEDPVFPDASPREVFSEEADRDTVPVRVVVPVARTSSGLRRPMIASRIVRSVVRSAVRSTFRSREPVRASRESRAFRPPVERRRFNPARERPSARSFPVRTRAHP